MVRRRVPACPELECVRHLLPPGILAAAAARSAEVGVDAEQVLIANGHLSEEIYVRALALWLGAHFETLEHPRAACPLPDEALLEGLRAGMLPLDLGTGLVGVVAPAMLGSRRLIMAVRPGGDLARRLVFTTHGHLRTFVLDHAAGALEHIAAERLRVVHPELSAAPLLPHPRRRLSMLAAATAIGGLVVSGHLLLAIEAALSLVAVAWGGLRLAALLSGTAPQPRRSRQPDAQLPVYTIIVALYREAAALPKLAKALAAFDYPLEKLDIKLALEPDDSETIQAAQALNLPPAFEIVIAPRGGPRTKPKALNAALQLARGAFVAVFDAEDRPEPDQLRLALDAFASDDPTLACVQGRLTIDNTDDSWIARYFTAEYAGLFDVLLPGLSAWQLPLPLGGTSNHFRTSVLRTIHAWDPYNVTEDADLGMRLARHGYRTTVMSSTTYEEAPARFWPWVTQRTRWFKGWMQTWCVHMRDPQRLGRELGWGGLAAFQLMVGGSTLAALAHIPFALWLVVQSVTGQLADTHWMHFTMLFAGYFVSGLLGFTGLWRRRLLGSAWVLALTPIYWLMLSLAAWRALHQVIRDPYRWEKTEHGLARTSRLSQDQR